MIPEPGEGQESDILRPGAQPLPGYRLQRWLGEGGFGEVWQAEAPGGVKVALKFVRLVGSTGTLEQRALDIIKEIRHPNLLSLFGAWRAHGFLIIGMDLADRTLADRLQEALEGGLWGIPRDELLEYLTEAAKGIDYLNAHVHSLDGRERVGIQHRDIKPQNILLVGGGVKVADFGLARLLGHSITGHTGSLTPAYAAPEFFNSQTSDTSDQYSLGVAYCELRGGRLPFTGCAVEVMAGHVMRPPDLTMLPEWERSAVARALAKDPKERWPNCRALVDAIRTNQPTKATTLDFSAATWTRPDAASDSAGRGEAPRPTRTPVVPPNSSTSPRGRNKGVAPTTRLPQGPGARDAVAGPSPPSPSRWGTGIRVASVILLLSVVGVALWNRGLFRPTPSSQESGPKPALVVPRDRGKDAAAGSPESARTKADGNAMTRSPHPSPAAEPASAVAEREANELLTKGETAAAVAKSATAERLRAQENGQPPTGPAAAVSAPDPAIRKVDGVDPSPAPAQVSPASGEPATPQPDAARPQPDAAPPAAPQPDAPPSAAPQPDAAPSAAPQPDAPMGPRPWVAPTPLKDGDSKSPHAAEASQRDREDAKAYNERGKSFMDEGTFDRAVETFSEVIRLRPRSDVAYFNRGTAYLAQGRHEAALADFNRAIQINPKEAAYYDNRGTAYARSGDYDSAIADYTEAIWLEPNDAQTYRKRGDAYSDKELYDPAISDYSKAIRLAPGYAAAYRNRADAYERKGDKAKADADRAEASRLGSASQQDPSP